MFLREYIAWLQEFVDKNPDLQVLFLDAEGANTTLRKGRLRVVFIDCWNDETFLERIEAYEDVDSEELKDAVAICLDNL